MADQQKYASKLSNARVLVIGGSSGIGYCVAEALVENNATVIISSSNQNRIDTAVSKLQSAYPSKKANISGYACDLANESTLDSNIKSLLDTATENKSKKLNHLVFTSGDPLKTGKLEEASFDTIKQAGMVRFFAPLITGKYAKQYIVDAAASSYTLTTGAVSERPIAGWTIPGAYATGLHGMMRGLALDLAPLRVNIISPGAVETNLWSGFSKEEYDGLKKVMQEKSTTGKMGQAEDVAESYIYCMRDHNCSGSVIDTNSGHLLIG